MSVTEARDAIRNFYVQKRLMKQDTGRLVVTLMSPRQYQVLVLRQESATFGTTNEGPIGTSKRGTGHFIDLIAYENDVLHALTLSGGLPGLDAYNEVVIQRGFFRPGADKDAVMKQVDAAPSGGQVIRIPLRQPCGAPMPFRPEDITLQTGDVVFLEAREDDLFYTGGLLPPGAYILPRDRDLDVLEAISRVRGPLFNGAFGGSNLSGTLIQPGIGNPSPSLLAVLRRTPGGGQVPIVVDLREATKHPEERLLIKPGDMLILQEKPGEAMARYFSQTFLNFDVAWNIFKTFERGRGDGRVRPGPVAATAKHREHDPAVIGRLIPLGDSSARRTAVVRRLRRLLRHCRRAGQHATNGRRLPFRPAAVGSVLPVRRAGGGCRRRCRRPRRPGKKSTESERRGGRPRLDPLPCCWFLRGPGPSE